MPNSTNNLPDDLAELKALCAQMDQHMEVAKAMVSQNQAFLDKHRQSSTILLTDEETPPAVQQI